MRRNAVAVVLFALALGLKFLLPAAAIAHAPRAGGPQPAFQECLGAAAEGALGHARTPGKGERHAESCPLCQLSCESAVALLGRPAQLDLVTYLDRTTPWRDAESARPRARPAVAHQARAPPRFS
ncbi:DUF2946 family protein [Methylocystis bryophila]|uniref:DUF2946 family protein n=1 Tax=Methylocystis bryophila TaxID=655015 RepID=UPI00131A167E|nr:DUF2946 family protein [Methylocystis bryophila]BDV40847.1 hypothetical protein DSM21852_41000 [Methylocystis bryophila]